MAAIMMPRLPKRGGVLALILLATVLLLVQHRRRASTALQDSSAGFTVATPLRKPNVGTNRQGGTAQRPDVGRDRKAEFDNAYGRGKGGAGAFKNGQGDFDVDGSTGGFSRNGKWTWDWLQNNAAERVRQGLEWAGVGENNDETNPLKLSTGNSGKDRAVGNGPHEDALAYHRHLEQSHSPHTFQKHSPTLTFDHIYVLSLTKRTDRRTRMSKIARALGLSFTYVDGTDKDLPLIGWIAERVKEVRDRKRRILATALDKPESEIGGLSVNSIWLKGNDRARGIKFPDMRKLDDRWLLSQQNFPQSGVETTSPAFMRDGDAVVNWVTYLDNTPAVDQLKPASSDEPLNITELLFDPVEDVEGRQVNEGVVATWYSQSRIWKKIVQSGDKSALILEDDIDLEFDIGRTWPNVERALPIDWDVVFLGHCWGRELTRAQYVHPSLRSASEPRCLHGYAVSSKGAKRLLELASDPWRAYQTPVDTLIPYFTRQAPDPSKRRKNRPVNPTHLVAFSMEPSVIIQSKDLTSDIQSGIGSTWRGVLADSTWDRIQRDEGRPVKQLTWDDTRDDPAVKARPWTEVTLDNKPKAKAHVANEAVSPSVPVDDTPVPQDEAEAREMATLGLTSDASDDDLDGPSEEDLEAEAARQAAREAAMARVIDNGQQEAPRLPKVPANLAGGKAKKLRPNPGSNADGNEDAMEDLANEQVQAVVDSLKKGEKGPKKGDGKRVGTGPKRIGQVEAGDSKLR